MRTALETLVARTNKPEYWNQLLNTAQGTKGLSDHQTLDIYRLKLLTSTIAKSDDYNLLAQLALQLGFAAEAQAVIEKGIAAKVLTGDRTDAPSDDGQGPGRRERRDNAAAPWPPRTPRRTATRWSSSAKTPGVRAVIPMRSSSSRPASHKGLTDKDNALIRLGVAYLSAGQKDQAIRSFEKADGDAKQKIIAHLWSIYARTH